jgi:hypothetical protein
MANYSTELARLRRKLASGRHTAADRARQGNFPGIRFKVSKNRSLTNQGNARQRVRLSAKVLKGRKHGKVKAGA